MSPELGTSVAQRLLRSKIPARLAFVGPNGDPHVVPIWFLWRHSKILLCGGAGSFKVKAIRKHPRVALSIDSEMIPYESLRIRGLAEIEVFDGIPVEYVECAHRYYGNQKGQQWIDWVSTYTTQMARISVTPDWVQALDFRERFSEIFD
jgi:nitroimidazol reductase NimA-like FMN-containing flavoprotein (pyridoxamine 5'-phosphate oxidase superfamily)